MIQNAGRFGYNNAAAGSQAAPFYKNRSIKPILKGNPFLHPFAEESFPDRDGLTKILNGACIL